MDIGDVVSDSLKYPSSNWSKVVILGILLLISILIIPIFLSLGYMFRVIKATLAGVDELPSFDEWEEMLIDGVKLFLVYLIYSLPAIIIGIFSVISLWSSLRSLIYITQTSGGNITPDAFFNILGGTFLIGMIIAGLYILVIYPIMAVAVGNMAYYNGELGAAFRFDEILSTIYEIGWVDLIIWYIMMIVLGSIIGFIGGIIGIIPIGWLVIILIVYPYLYLFYSRAVARLYLSAFEEEYMA